MQLGPIIIDFRSDAELNEHTDEQISGIETIHIPIVDNLTAGISRESGSLEELFKRFILDPKGSKEYICEMYRSFASDNAVRKMRRFKQQIADSECIEVLKSTKRGVVSLISDDGYPYGIPILLMSLDNTAFGTIKKGIEK